MGSLIEFLLILLLTLMNGVFSMSETAVVSVRRARLQQRADAGDDAAKAALALVRRPDRFLSTVQIGITLIGILSGAFGGAGLSEEIAHRFERFGIAPSTAKTLGFTLVVVVITYLSLVIGELVPKSLALNNAEGIACRIAKPMALLSRFASPLVGLLTVSTNGILRLMGVRQGEEQPVTEDEINILISQGVTVGAFAEEEQEIVERVFRTADWRVSQLMTPRREVVYLDIRDDWPTNQTRVSDTPHAAFLVCDGGLDEVLGVVSLKSIWSAGLESGANGSGPDLRALAEEPPYVLETTRALTMLEKFRRSLGQHLALVVDEYGNVVGLITLHDVIEGIVGEMPSAEQVRTQDLSAVRRDDGSWLLDGMLPLGEAIRILEIGLPEDAAEYSTLGGFVMARLERIPTTGDHFDWEGWAFEVMDMDSRRVDKVLARSLSPKEGSL